VHGSGELVVLLFVFTGCSPFDVRRIPTPKTQRHTQQHNNTTNANTQLKTTNKRTTTTSRSMNHSGFIGSRQPAADSRDSEH